MFSWTPCTSFAKSQQFTLLRAGRHQGPNLDGLVPGSVGVVQHAALSGICASVQCSWIQTYQGNDEALNAQWGAGTMHPCMCPGQPQLQTSFLVDKVTHTDRLPSNSFVFVLGQYETSFIVSQQNSMFCHRVWVPGVFSIIIAIGSTTCCSLQSAESLSHSSSCKL